MQHVPGVAGPGILHQHHAFASRSMMKVCSTRDYASHLCGPEADSLFHACLMTGIDVCVSINNTTSMLMFDDIAKRH